MGAPRPGAGAQFDQSHALQMKQGFANGRASDTELLHQVAFGGQLVALGHIAVADPLLEDFGNLLVKFGPAQRLGHAQR